MFRVNLIEKFVLSLPEYQRKFNDRNFIEIYSYNGLLATRKVIEFDGTTVLCRVCGDKASGFHYGVHACEGCKGFFRRSIQQKLQYRPCLKNQQCNIMRVNRNRCQYCRLRKCIAVGMSRDAVRFGRVPKREKAKIMEQMHRVNAQSQMTSLTSVLEDQAEVIQTIVEAHHRLCEFTSLKHRVFLERAWRKPDVVDCPPHKACPLNPTPSQATGQWDFNDLFTPAIRNVVNFAKCIPGFQVFCQEDQVNLLKAGTFEVLLVHLAPLFDYRTSTMLFANGQIYKRTAAMPVNHAGYLLDSMFDFAGQFNRLGLTDAEVALFSALVVAAEDRPGLRFPDQVAQVKATIEEGLEALVRANHPNDPTLFSRLLLKKPDLKTLNILHSEKLLGLTVPSQETDISHDLQPNLGVTSRTDVNGVKVTDPPVTNQSVGVEIPKQEMILSDVQGRYSPLYSTPTPSTCPIVHSESPVPSRDTTLSRSPEPLEMDVPGCHDALSNARFSNKSHIASGLGGLKRSSEGLSDLIEKNPKMARLWEFDMRSSRSGSMSSNSSHESSDSAYRTISSPGTPHTASRSPLTASEDLRIHVPTLKEALTSPPLSASSSPLTLNKCPHIAAVNQGQIPTKETLHHVSPGSLTTEKLLQHQHMGNKESSSPPPPPPTPGLIALQYQAMLHPAVLYRHYAALHHQMLQSHLQSSKHSPVSHLLSPSLHLSSLPPPALQPHSICREELPDTQAPCSPPTLLPIKVEQL